MERRKRAVTNEVRRARGAMMRVGLEDLLEIQLLVVEGWGRRGGRWRDFIVLTTLHI